jgi:hypothetical protein
MTDRVIILSIAFLLAGWHSYCQAPALRKDSILFGIRVPPFFTKDSLSKMDTLPVKTWMRLEKSKITHSMEKGENTAINKTRRPFLDFTGGYASYTFNYRSDLDTPYTEKNIAQHQVLSTLNFRVGGLVPIKVNSFIRRSNSMVFQDITDVQVAFDANAYRSGLASMLRQRLMRQTPGSDSLAGKLYGLRRGQMKELDAWLQDPLTRQKLIEAN